MTRREWRFQAQGRVPEPNRSKGSSALTACVVQRFTIEVIIENVGSGLIRSIPAFTDRLVEIISHRLTRMESDSACE